VNAHQDDRTETAGPRKARGLRRAAKASKKPQVEGPGERLQREPHRQQDGRRAAAAPRAVFSGRPAACATSRKEADLARYEHAPRHVVEARYLGDYKVWLEFNDGRRGVVDLADELYGEQMEPLRNRERFSQFYLDYGLATICWHDGQDFTPEFLYEKLTAVN
jgi:hypothetical protein